MVSEKYKLCLRELSLELKSIACEQKQKCNSMRAKLQDSEFEEGYLCAMHRVISLMIQQAESLGIGLEELELSDIEPNKDLI